MNRRQSFAMKIDASITTYNQHTHRTVEEDEEVAGLRAAAAVSSALCGLNCECCAADMLRAAAAAGGGAGGVNATAAGGEGTGEQPVTSNSCVTWSHVHGCELQISSQS